MRITVFTPTYNRVYIIEKLYETLKKQTFTDFEWIVVDDGSTDGTDKLFESILIDGSNNFKIKYVKVENGGKHRAINKGVTLASGELFYIVDSDDHLPFNALEIIDRTESTIPQNEKHLFAGICGAKGYSEDVIIGKTFSGDFLDITTLERPMHNIFGDKAEVFYTDILKKYPFPEFDGENFITECVVWDKIAADGYKLRFFNQIVMICNYLPDGLSAQGRGLFEKNPQGWGLYISQSVLYEKLKGINKWNEYLQFFYTVRGYMKFKKIAKILNISPITLWFRINGLRLFYKIYK